MHSLIQKILQKRKIQSVEQLDDEEKATYENWQKILSKEELTIEDVKQFCQTEIGIIETKWKDYGLENVKKAELIPYHTVYKTLLNIFDSPKAERERLEYHLNQLLK